MNYIKKGIPFMLLIFLLLPSVSVLAKEQMDERVYYILVDRFVNGDNNNDIEIDIDNPEAYYGGDFQGIIDKLSNLQKLGITTINLSPIMVASSYNGFDPVDYQSVDPQFGDMADLQQLVAEAHENDMEVVLDFPITHVAENHSWTSENTDWIKDASTNQLEEQLPAINLDSQEVQEYFLETAVYWMKSANVDGFHIYVNDQIPELFIEQLRERIFNEDEQATLIIDGMETEVGSSMLPSFRTEAVTILKQPGQSVEPLLRNELTGVHYLESVLTPRFAHEAVQAGFNPVTRWQLASTLLYTLPGASFLYQGVEVPMDNGLAEADHRMAELNKEDEQLIQHIEKLAEIHQKSSALQQGDLDVVMEAGAMAVYKRSDQNQTMYIAINNDTETQVASLEGINENEQLRGLLDDNIVRVQEDGTHKVILERETSNIFILEENTGLNWFFISMLVVIMGGFVAFIVAVNVKSKKVKK